MKYTDMEPSETNANKKKRFSIEKTTNQQSNLITLEENVVQFHSAVLDENVLDVEQSPEKIISRVKSITPDIKTDADIHSIDEPDQDIIGDTDTWKISPEKSPLSQPEDFDEELSKTSPSDFSTPPTNRIVQTAPEHANLILPKTEATDTSSINEPVQPASVDNNSVLSAEDWKIHIGVGSHPPPTQSEQADRHPADSKKSINTDTSNADHICNYVPFSNTPNLPTISPGSHSSKSEKYHTTFSLRVCVVIAFSLVRQLVESTWSYIFEIVQSAIAAYVSVVTWVMLLPFRVAVYLFWLVSRTILAVLTYLLDSAAVYGGTKIADGVNGHVKAN